MTPTRWLVAYLAGVAGLGALHQPALLAAALLSCLAAAGTRRWRLLRRTLTSVLAFNLVLSLAYAAMAGLQQRFEPGYLLQINLRVLLLVFLGFWFVSRVDLRQALAPWPTLALVATLAVGQATVFRRTLNDFRLAFCSRNPCPAGWLQNSRHAAAQATHLLDKAEAGATECRLALRSRGCFDD
ncbi:ABC transporter permease [Pseudorhodoferax sp.]|uniref:ABC transporter permease n=1 Tax=Pseudorhodoferax sp. TaxID=1993553 RepID=UPI002DD62E52|nr:ABC transporter permease [Pseudorhodoferax sp.]